jgi:DNA-binding XRE family transcriptional regulator
MVKLYCNVKKILIFGKDIKKYRVQKGISQDKLSKLADTTLHTVTEMDADHVSA